MHQVRSYHSIKNQVLRDARELSQMDYLALRAYADKHFKIPLEFKNFKRALIKILGVCYNDLKRGSRND